ncbi:MAG TPA: hypothetical protein VGF99_13700 [Myxococcota bacterium]
MRVVDVALVALVVAAVCSAAPAAAENIVVRDIADAPKGQALVLLANEPAPDDDERARVDEIIGWLASSDDDDHKDDDHLLAASLMSDARDFPRAVDHLVDTLAAAATDLDGVAIVTNRGLRRGVLQMAWARQPLHDVAFALPEAFLARADGRRRASPLSDAAVVEAVLARLHNSFTGQRLVVVTFSHGDHEHALTPRLGLPTVGLTRETLLARVHGDEDDDDDRTPTTRYGMRTADLIERIEWHLPNTELLVLGSCGSQLTTTPKFLKNVLVAKDGGPIAYGALDIGRVLARRGESKTLKDAVVTTWTPAPFERADPQRVRDRERDATLARAGRLALWCTPLLLWLVVVGGALMARRRRRRTISSG